MPNAEAQPPIWPINPAHAAFYETPSGGSQLPVLRVESALLFSEEPLSDTGKFLRPGAQDILAAMEAFYENRFQSEAKRFVEDDGALFVGNNGNREYARNYWLRLGLPLDAINNMVDIAGRIVETPDKRNPYTMHPLEAGLCAIEQADGFYDHNPKPLHDGILKEKHGIDGFNDHRKPHVRKVTKDAYRLLTEAQLFRTDITTEDFYETTLGTAIHDMGNILNRKLHARISPLLAERRIPILTQNKTMWEKIKRVAIFHNEPEIRDVIEHVWHTKDDAAATIAAMQKDFSPALIAAIIADKLHLGPDRLPNIWKDPEGMMRDWQIAINAAFRMRNFGYSNDGRTFDMTIGYNPGMEMRYFAEVNDSSSDSHPSMRRSRIHEEGRFIMPQAIHKYLKDRKASHSEVLEAIFWSDDGYKDRMRLAITAAFALNPTTETVTVNIVDDAHIEKLREFMNKDGQRTFDEARIQEIMHRKYTFTKEDIDQQLQKIQESFTKKGIDLEDLKKARGEAREKAA